MEEFNNVTIFPNPVPKDFWGEIIISGLKDNTNIKITDIAGNLVFETFSLGGTATWNGKNFEGRNVSTGVYLFLCTDDLFNKSVVKKVSYTIKYKMYKTTKGIVLRVTQYKDTGLLQMYTPKTLVLLV